MNKKIFWFFSIGIVIFGLYHLTGIFYEIDASPAWRHGIFFVFSIFGVYGVLKRPTFFVFLFPILLGEQIYSHGSDFIDFWVANHKIDWISLYVIFFMSTLYVFLVLDMNKKN